MKTLLLVLLVTLSVSSAALAQRLSTKLSLLSWSDPKTPTIQIGLEYRFLKNWATEINYGLRTKTNPLAYKDNFNMRYYKIKTEVKYYISRKKVNQWYVGIAYQYMPISYNTYEDNFATDGVDYKYSQAHVSHYASVFALKGGHLKQINNILGVDFFGGIGIRNVDIRHSNFVGLQEDPEIWNEGPSIGTDYYDGSYVRLHLELGVKLSFNIIKK